MNSAYQLNKQGEYTALTYSFPNLEPVCCFMSGSNFCFLTCIQISQEAGQVVWCSHLFKNFPEFVVIHTVKGFGIVNKAEIDVFLELSCFFNDPMDKWLQLLTENVWFVQLLPVQDPIISLHILPFRSIWVGEEQEHPYSMLLTTWGVWDEQTPW